MQVREAHNQPDFGSVLDIFIWTPCVENLEQAGQLLKTTFLEDVASHLVRRRKSFKSRQRLKLLRSKLNWRRQVLSCLHFFHLELRKLMAWSCVGWWVSWVCILSNPQVVLEIMRQRLEHSSLKKQGCWLKRSTRNCRWVSVSNADRALNFVSSCQIILAQEHADISWIQLGQNLTTPWMQVWMWLLRIFWAKGGSPAKSANPSPRERNAPAASSRGT